MKGGSPESYLPSAESAGPCSGSHPSVSSPAAQQSPAFSPGSQESSFHPVHRRQQHQTGQNIFSPIACVLLFHLNGGIDHKAVVAVAFIWLVSDALLKCLSHYWKIVTLVPNSLFTVVCAGARGLCPESPVRMN